MRRTAYLVILTALPFAASAAQQRVRAVGDTLSMTTWSVVGVDPKTGDVGVAMASCVPNTLADALAALVPGKGAASTQAAFDIDNRNKIFAALKEARRRTTSSAASPI